MFLTPINLEHIPKTTLINLKFKAGLMWKDYFETMVTKYTKEYDLLLPYEKKNTIKNLTCAYLDYKYNPLPEGGISKEPGYRFTNNKNEINLITLSLKDVFAMWDLTYYGGVYREKIY